jgi:hypothetical protein
MWNPFKNTEKEAIEQQKMEQDNNMANTILGNPQQQYDELRQAERRDMLLQLSQWQQDRSPAMRKLFLKLAGSYVDTKDVIRPLKWDKGYLSLLGSAKMVGFIESLDHNVMLANWSEHNIILTMRDAIAHPLRRFMIDNHRELGLNLQHAEYVFWLIINTIEPNYYRGWNDGERRKDKEIIKVNEIHNPYFVNQKKGIFGMQAN